MKKSSALLIAATLMLSACGSMAKYASSDSGQKYKDGIYSNTPAFRTKEEKEESKSETQALVEKTKESQIYLFGDKKDSVAIPQDMSAMIKYDQKLGGTVVTVGENPYDWRYDLENNYGYYYGPYSIGSSWYWSRHYSPWYSWSCSPWRYHGWYDPWYYGSMYDPWYYNGWYDPWYGGWYGYYDPWYYGSHWHYHHYCGWYGGWDPYWGHHHGHGPVFIPDRPGDRQEVRYVQRYRTEPQRVFSSNSVRRGSSTRTSSVSRSSSTGREGAVVSSSAARSGRGTATRVSTNRGTPSRVSASTSTRRPGATASGTRTEVQTNYRRPAGTSATSSRPSSYNGSSSSSGGRNSSGYTRSSSSYDRSSSSFDRGSSSYSRSSSSSVSRSSSSYSSGGRSSGGGYSGGSSGGRRR